MAPLAIDLFCGLGGWTEGLLAEGWFVVGFDIERHDYGTGGYPAQLVLQDVLTLHGAQFKDADLIVASPPCQAYSYRAMPWSRAKALPPPDNSLFDACFRIQREACAAAGRHVPMVVENVRGAQKWVGRSRWNYGSFHLWGDVPALMPMTQKRQIMKNGITHRSDGSTNFHGQKNNGGSWFAIANNTTSGHSKNPVNEGFKSHGMNWSNRELRGQDFTRIGGKQAEGVKGSEGYERDHPNALDWKKPNTSSHSSARKAASAAIAKIPFPLARYLARVFMP
jgi:hypothetical protein